jgi:AmmeMemoRadiSam system protein B/AmmeMemoRadiSam system protein A
MFYPSSASELCRQVDDLLAGAARQRRKAVPKALIAPHAGYIYSGPVAASAYAQVAPAAARIRRVALLGPAHRVPLRGLALPATQRLATPLGEVAVDAEAVAALRALPQVVESARAHAAEHSLEVHLPFLQRVLGEFTLVPLVVGDATSSEVAAVLDHLWGDEQTLIVVSSDLSHYLPYDIARRTDQATITRVQALQPTLGHEQACGATPVNGLLQLAQGRGLRAEVLDLRNSGDTAGDHSRVVGYAAVAFYEPEAPAARSAAEDEAETDARGPVLLAHARAAIAGALQLDASVAPDRAFLRQPGASFVTLHRRRELRGCIGSLTARRPLGVDVRENAVAAAFSDPRFRPLTRSEYAEVDVEVSVLSASTPLAVGSEAELLSRLRAGVDGLTLEFGDCRGTFLPQVWQSLPDAREFVAELKRKAGLPRDFWSPQLQVSRYTVDKYTEPQAWVA